MPTKLSTKQRKRLSKKLEKPTSKVSTQLPVARVQQHVEQPGDYSAIFGYSPSLIYKDLLKTLVSIGLIAGVLILIFVYT